MPRISCAKQYKWIGVKIRKWLSHFCDKCQEVVLLCIMGYETWVMKIWIVFRLLNLKIEKQVKLITPKIWHMINNNSILSKLFKYFLSALNKLLYESSFFSVWNKLATIHYHNSMSGGDNRNNNIANTWHIKSKLSSFGLFVIRCQQWTRIEIWKSNAFWIVACFSFPSNHHFLIHRLWIGFPSDRIPFGNLESGPMMKYDKLMFQFWIFNSIHWHFHNEINWIWIETWIRRVKRGRIHISVLVTNVRTLSEPCHIKIYWTGIIIHVSSCWTVNSLIRVLNISPNILNVILWVARMTFIYFVFDSQMGNFDH